ncbi:hypothetical protein QFZ27_006102 [Inquilinus ginsengisoli]|uniref:hypothetical protein n=1 Tax=Inquilinus ginsengisoli TaxID=363840 RepID=UPI003D250ED2
MPTLTNSNFADTAHGCRRRMMHIEIRPTISVWDDDRWLRIDTGAKLLDLLRVLVGELPEPGFVMPHAGPDSAASAGDLIGAYPPGVHRHPALTPLPMPSPVTGAAAGHGLADQ